MVEWHSYVIQRDRCRIACADTQLVFQLGDGGARCSRLYDKGAHTSTAGRRIDGRPDNNESGAELVTMGERLITSGDEDLFTCDNPLNCLTIQHSSRTDR